MVAAKPPPSRDHEPKHIGKRHEPTTPVGMGGPLVLGGAVGPVIHDSGFFADSVDSMVRSSPAVESGRGRLKRSVSDAPTAPSRQVE